MDLSTFIGETLRQIAAGVKSAQVDVENMGGMINPQRFVPPSQSPNPLYDFNTNSLITLVEMEVLVKAVDSADKKGGLMVAVGVVSAGGGRGTSESHEATSRVRFSVPMQLPLGGKPLPPMSPTPAPTSTWSPRV